MISEEITKIINNWMNSQKRTDMLTSQSYYLSQNNILNRRFWYFKVNQKLEDKYRSNVKISNNFLSTVVDQKVSYCLAKDVIIDAETVFDINDNIDETAEEASIKSVGWTHIYVDKFGNIKLKTMESENIIPVLDGSIEENLEYVIRTYEVSDNKMAQLWDSDYITTYKLNDKGLYVEQSKQTHLDNDISWGLIPFIPLYNNRYKTTDLNNIKILIDTYDFTESDFANNFIDFQELILFIKNYNENVATAEAASELMDWIKKYKVINVKADGDLKIISQEVPYLARIEFLNLLKNNIYAFSQSVDINELSGGSLTNVAIEAHFSLLDMKSNKFLKECKRYIQLMLQFTNKWNEMKNLKEINIPETKITFNKTIIINEKERIDGCVASENVISTETVIENHPFVEDSNEEIERFKEQQLMYSKSAIAEDEDI